MQDYRAKTYNVACLVQNQVYTLYTCPQNTRAVVNLLYLSNANDGNTTINVEWERADGSHVHIIGGKNIGAGEFIQWSQGYIVFEPGDYFTATASANATPHMDVMCTVEEYFMPNRSI